MRKHIKIIAIVIAAIFVFGVLAALIAPVFASAAPSIEQQIKDQQTKQKELEGKIDAADAKKTEIEQKKKIVDDEITVLQGEIEVLDGELGVLNTEIAQKEAEIKEAQKVIDDKNNKYKQRVRVMYEEGGTGYIQALLESVSVNDFLYRYEIVQEVLLHDKDILTEMKEAKQRQEDAKAVVESNKQKVDVQKVAADGKKATASVKQAEQQRLIDELKADKAAWEKQLDAAEAAEAALKRQVASSASNSATSTYTGGKFAWPCPSSTRITSPFSTARQHPVLGYVRRHDGIDIGASTGSAVVAAGDGTVIFAGWNGGYGNCVIIDHGGGYTTLYGHGSALVASKGQKVSRGDLIMKVGSTGTSTGPHLHFEVCINGVAKEPTQFLR